MQGVSQASRRHGWAWIALTLALAVHVADEALTDFLSVYNPAVRAIRQRLPLLPLPTFSFMIWLTGLIALVLLLLVLSRLVFRGARRMVPVSYLLGGIMLANGLGHIAGSLYLNRLMPGVYSAPLLLVSSVYLVAQARRVARTREPPPTKCTIS